MLRPRGGSPPAGHTTARGSRPTYCARENTRGPAARDQVQLRAQQAAPGPGGRAGHWAAGPRGPRARTGSGSGCTAGGGTASAPLPQSAPARREQGCVSKRSWFPGLLSEQNHPDPRAARARPRRAPGIPRTEASGPSSPGRRAGPLRTAAAAAGGRAGPRRCGPAARGSQARARGTYRAAARCGARALSAARAGPLRAPAGPPTPPRFPPARPALAPSARLRWNQ